MSEPTLSSILPVAARNAAADGMSKNFKSTLKLPKGMARYMVARAVDRVLLEHLTVTEVKTKMGLLRSEVEYIEKVIEEFRAWEAASKAAS